MLKNNMFSFAEKIIPYNRSIVSKEVLRTLKIIKKKINKLKVINVKSGKKIYDWKVPKEWKVNSAKILDKRNQVIIDYDKNNLHLVSHSVSVNKLFKFKDLKKKIYFLKKLPKAIPYRTSYYKKDWGFCVSYNQFKKFKNQSYKVVIDTELSEGNLRYGEIFIKGKSSKEILFTTNICHPSLANNETSGIVVLTFLANYLSRKSTKYSYRLIFIPETIGALVYIKSNFENLKKNLLFGFNCLCVGDNRKYSILESKFKNSNSKYFAIKTLKKLKKNFKLYSWLDRGSDERQFSSPIIDLDFSSLMRSKYGEYKEYHTSLDTLKNVVNEKGLQGSFKMYQVLIDLIEKEEFPKSKYIGEPFLSKRNIYPYLGGGNHYKKSRDILNYLSFCNGKTPTEKIAKDCKLNLKNSRKILKILKKNKLIVL